MTIPSPYLLSKADVARLRAHGPDSSAVIDPDLPDRRLGEICGKLQLSWVPLKDHLDRGDYREWDDHWNERGHHKVAQVLWDVYSEYRRKTPPMHVEAVGKV